MDSRHSRHVGDGGNCRGRAGRPNSGLPCAPGCHQGCSPSGLPAALRERMGNVALPGEPFNTIDVYVEGQPSRRYIFVWNIGRRWIVATEVGGIAVRAAVSIYDLDHDSKTANLIDDRITFPQSVCAVATKLAGR
jgi:hypothetical protein